MTSGRGASEVDVGARIQPLVVWPSRAHLFMFSAITWNRHHVHYDREAAIREGLPDVVVHRGLVGNYIARCLVEWAGQLAAIRSLSWRMLGSAVPGTALTCQGQVTRVDVTHGRQEVQCELEVLAEGGRPVATGHATVVLPQVGG